MIAQVLLLLCSIHVILSFAPPKISESFSATVSLVISDEEGEHEGVGVWAVDETGEMAVENYKFHEPSYDIFDLQRYDLGIQYFLDPMNTSSCKHFSVDGTMPHVWDWVNLTSYVNTVPYNNESIDIWEVSLGYAYLQIAVFSNDTSTPLYLFRGNRGERNSTYEFFNWNDNTPNPKLFTVPSACNQSVSEKSDVTCSIQRSEIMARAKVWVTNQVPYNQGGTYQGYREDCSGYVSMCWASSEPGHTTYTMNQIAHQINKGDLQPGDCLLYAAEHVVLFGGWLNSGQTQYQAFEETQPGEGTVSRPTPYPYWYSQSDFIPFRYNDVC